MAEYEIFAIRYAWRDARRSDHFIGGDPHDGPMPMDYFMWVARGGGRTFVIAFGGEVVSEGKFVGLNHHLNLLAALPEIVLLVAPTVRDAALQNPAAAPTAAPSSPRK